jgi:diadenosine tetraphosphate (Ap4A) HIT family hydrolase
MRLAADSVLVAEGPLSQVRLMNDERWPWLVLVPRVAGASEWIDLDGNQQRQAAGRGQPGLRLLREEAGVDKLNIGALGNIVRQLHVHLVGRHEGDAAWPGPVWGSGPAHRFEPDSAGPVSRHGEAASISAHPPRPRRPPMRSNLLPR